MLADLTYFFFIFLNKTNNRFSIVFRDILCLIFCFLFLYLFFLVAILILWNPFFFCDSPSLFIEGMAVCDLWKNGSRVIVYDGAFLILLFYYLIHNTAIVYLLVIIPWEYIIYFHFIKPLTLLLLVIIREHRKIEYGWTIPWLYEDRDVTYAR